MRATEHAPRDPCHVLERRHGLAEIIERGAIVAVKRHRENPLHFEQTKDLTRLKTFLHTAIGKPGHEATQWVVDELVKRLPAGVIATQGAVAGAVGREVAAAAELGVLRHATHAVLVTGSTFSEVAMRWRTQSNQSAPVVVRLI